MRRPEPGDPRATKSERDRRDSAPPSGDGRGAIRRDHRAAATQERILDAAEQEFAARGFAGARLREIAVGANVQPALIHHYFSDKQGLYEAVIRRAVEHMSVASWRVLESAPGLEGLVRGFVDVMVDFSAAHQKMLAILRSELLAGAHLLVDVVRERTQPLLEAVVAIAERLQENGELRRDVDAREMVRSGLSLILYPAVDAAVLEALLPERGDVDALARRKHVIAQVLLGGIRATGRSP